MIIAVDGPAAAGKGTLARALAEHYGYAYLETGLLYRAVGMRVLRAGAATGDQAAAVAAAGSLTETDLKGPDLRRESTGAAASAVAVFPAVRAVLLDFQREFAKNPPGQAPGAVIDGRDIGTVVCPDADVKIFITASAKVRARRRFVELRAKGNETTEAQVLEDLEARDARDAERSVSPMVRARDAHLLDTTNLDIDSALHEAIVLITQAQGKSGE